MPSRIDFPVFDAENKIHAVSAPLAAPIYQEAEPNP
jgi:hypothetical protein